MDLDTAGEVFSCLGFKPVHKSAGGVGGGAGNAKTGEKVVGYCGNGVVLPPGSAEIDLYAGKRTRTLLKVFYPNDALKLSFTNEVELMKLPADWNERAIYEGNRLRQSLKLLLQPIGMAGQERACIFNAASVRKRQYGSALRVADFKGKALRAGRPPQFDRTSDVLYFKRARLSLLIGNRLCQQHVSPPCPVSMRRFTRLRGSLYHEYS